jgi:hypothetical protein
MVRGKVLIPAVEMISNQSRNDDVRCETESLTRFSGEQNAKLCLTGMRRTPHRSLGGSRVGGW